MNEYQVIGKMLAYGAMNAVGVAVAWLIMAVYVLNVLFNLCNVGVDNSDLDGRNRSGLKVHTDHLTGVQYLSDGKGGLHVRVGKDGLPVTR